MSKIVFTFIFLIVSLIIATKLQSFVKNNMPANSPVPTIVEDSQTIDLVNPVIYEASTSNPVSTSTMLSTSTAQ